MKRRLDLALALVHGRASCSSTSPPPASTRRAAARSGTRSQRLASDSGVTVFLTTQYLEEADVLADRVGIIDHGRIVAEGTPGRAQGRDRPPDRRGRPRPSTTTWAAPARCWPRFGEPANSSPKGAAVRLSAGEAQLAEVVRAARRGGHPGGAPPAARAHARRRLPRQDRPLARGVRGSRNPIRPSGTRSRLESQHLRVSGRDAGAAVGAAHAAPARDGDPVAGLPDAAAGDQLQRARLRDQAARLPVRLLLGVRARDPVRPGSAVRGQQRGHQRRLRRRDRASSTGCRSRRCGAWRCWAASSRGSWRSA